MENAVVTSFASLSIAPAYAARFADTAAIPVAALALYSGTAEEATAAAVSECRLQLQSQS